MLAGATAGRRIVYATVLAAMLPFGSQVAQARGFAHHGWHHAFRYSGFHSFWHSVRAHSRYARYYGGYAHHYGGGLQCVAFVRQETGVQLIGNAAGWWHEADGLYDRGSKPEAGAVLVFRGARRMRLGHVAVVSGVLGNREIDINHAHWAGYGIHRQVSVIDVSPGNDWTAVRVAIRAGGTYGSVYPTYGFIYDRTPGPRLQEAKATDTTPAIVQKASATELPESLDTDDAPRPGLRWHFRRHWRRLVARRHVIAEVAEQPASGPH